MIRGTPGLRPALADGQECVPVCLCRRCGGEMYSGETAYLWENRQICADCFQGAVTAWLREAAWEAALALGVETWAL